MNELSKLRSVNNGSSKSKHKPISSNKTGSTSKIAPSKRALRTPRTPCTPKGSLPPLRQRNSSSYSTSKSSTIQSPSSKSIKYDGIRSPKKGKSSPKKKNVRQRYRTAGFPETPQLKQVSSTASDALVQTKSKKIPKRKVYQSVYVYVLSENVVV